MCHVWATWFPYGVYQYSNVLGWRHYVIRTSWQDWKNWKWETAQRLWSGQGWAYRSPRTLFGSTNLQLTLEWHCRLWDFWEWDAESSHIWVCSRHWKGWLLLTVGGWRGWSTLCPWVHWNGFKYGFALNCKWCPIWVSVDFWDTAGFWIVRKYLWLRMRLRS